MTHPNAPDPDAERSARINAWLRGRGLRRTVTSGRDVEPTVLTSDELTRRLRAAAGYVEQTTETEEQTDDDA